jgi:hypothetical protein
VRCSGLDPPGVGRAMSSLHFTTRHMPVAERLQAWNEAFGRSLSPAQALRARWHHGVEVPHRPAPRARARHARRRPGGTDHQRDRLPGRSDRVASRPRRCCSARRSIWSVATGSTSGNPWRRESPASSSRSSSRRRFRRFGSPAGGTSTRSRSTSGSHWPAGSRGSRSPAARWSPSRRGPTTSIG